MVTNSAHIKPSVLFEKCSEKLQKMIKNIYFTFHSDDLHIIAGNFGEH